MTRTFCILAVALLLEWGLNLGHAADPKTPAYTDPKAAGVDFDLQGEYAGDVQTDNGKRKVGMQVIALGDGKFRVMAFVGGLPGDGWKRGDEIHMAEGQLENRVVHFVREEKAADLKDGKITVFSNGKPTGELSKVQRQSPTLGAKAPAGAIVLFDGSSADQFEGGKLIEGNLLSSGCVSKHKFGDHSMHIEFRTPFMPKSEGQGRGNSGVYPQSRYEVQVLDSFGLEGKNNECGGIYSIAEPAVNMCLPPLSWQTYDIDFTAATYDASGKKTKNARITVKHNGVVIHENTDLANGTPGRLPEGSSLEGLYLQDHGNPVAFRNIWVVEKK